MFQCSNMCEMSVWNTILSTVCFCVFCEFLTYFPWIILKTRIITSGGLCCFYTAFYPPVCLNCSFQCFSGAPQGGTPLFSGVAKRWLPGCSVTVQILRFCTCFQDNWHLKRRLWLLTLCPWPALCLHLKTVWFNLWLFHYFPLKLSTKSLYPCGGWQPTLRRANNVCCKFYVNSFYFVVEMKHNPRFLAHFNSRKDSHWGRVESYFVLNVKNQPKWGKTTATGSVE